MKKCKYCKTKRFICLNSIVGIKSRVKNRTLSNENGKNEADPFRPFKDRLHRSRYYVNKRISIFKSLSFATFFKIQEHWVCRQRRWILKLGRQNLKLNPLRRQTTFISGKVPVKAVKIYIDIGTCMLRRILFKREIVKFPCKFVVLLFMKSSL